MEDSTQILPEILGESLEQRLGIDAPTIIFIGDVHASSIVQNHIAWVYLNLVLQSNLTRIGEEGKFNGIDISLEPKNPVKSFEYIGAVLEEILENDGYDENGNWINASTLMYYAANNLGFEAEFFGYENKEIFDDFLALLVLGLYDEKRELYGYESLPTEIQEIFPREGINNEAYLALKAIKETDRVQIGVDNLTEYLGYDIGMMVMGHGHSDTFRAYMDERDKQERPINYIIFKPKGEDELVEKQAVGYVDRMIEGFGTTPVNLVKKGLELLREFELNYPKL